MYSKKNPSGGRSNQKRTENAGSARKPGKKNITVKPKSTDFKKEGKSFQLKPKKRVGDPLPNMNENEVRLNKYLSNAGICSRREADVLIQTGVISVNGKIVTEMGMKISPTDVVQYDGQTISTEKKRYVLLNKPKDFITSTNDPWGRKTVMSLVIKACKERVYPVGRLDRETTGLMLFTNDGDLTKKLLHPTRIAPSLFHVETDRSIKPEDLAKLTTGIQMDERSVLKVKKAEYVSGKDNREAGIEIASEKSHNIRKMFERLGYKVVKLDRVMFAGLTKKDLPRGHFRHLTEKEIAFLRMN